MRVAHATGDLGTRARALLRDHYLGTDGGAGYLYAAVDDGDAVFGAVLIGSAASRGAEQAIADAPGRVWCVKRLYCRDDCPMPESQLLRAALRAVALRRGQTLIFVAYADPAALNPEGLPLTGFVYLASGFLFAGLTSQPRSGLVDQDGRARSARQGKITLTRKTLPAGWTMVKLPPARVWLAVVAPEAVQGQPTSQRWRRRQWRALWAALHPQRRVAAQQWTDDRTWRRGLRLRSLGAPRRRRGCQRLQPAYWQGGELQRSAGPVWVPMSVQGNLLQEADVLGERTAGRSYLPRLLAAAA